MLTTTTTGPRYWHQLQSHTDASATVLFFPFAGGGVDSLRTLDRLLPPGCDAYCLSLPRNGDGEAAPSPTLAEIAEPIARELAAGPLRPVVLVGMSMGALFALKVASHLAATPRVCVVIAQSPAGLTRLHPAPFREDDYCRLLEAGGAIAPDALADAEVRDEITRRLRTAFSVVREDDIRAVRDDCAEEIFYAGGATDLLVPPGEMRQWHDLTHGRVTGRILPGGHFFAFEKSNENAVREMLGAAVERAVSQHAQTLNQKTEGVDTRE
ncbi:alpha/beta fold hydrolase [Streptomyces sp. NPDC001793]|uniref:thioesterase II family protein n=1 Tax=Streptomyces sp. NPDC001793 TaxID=3154657 RepID=UPI0033349ACD